MWLAALEETRLGDAEGALQTTALAIRDALSESGEPEIRVGITTGEALIALNAGRNDARCVC